MDINTYLVPEEVDQTLLQQLSSRNTTEREELIKQMQELFGHKLNYNTAVFFLDMSNWNLQAAVRYGLDYILQPKKHQSKSIAVLEKPEEPLAPGASFKQVWYIKNCSKTDKLESFKMSQIHGEPFHLADVRVPSLQPGEARHVTLNFTAPTTPGTYRSYFQVLTENEELETDVFWVEITVKSVMEGDLTTNP